MIWGIFPKREYISYRMNGFFYRSVAHLVLFVAIWETCRVPYVGHQWCHL